MDWTMKWVIAAGITGLTWGALAVARGWGGRRLTAFAERSGHEADDLLAALVLRTQIWFIIAAGLYAGTLALDLPARPARLLGLAIGLALLFQVVVWGNAVITFVVGRYVRRRVEQDAASATTAAVLSFLARLGLGAVALLLALDNLGVDITALIAGLGVGGIAVALALQSVLGDVFAAFAIMLDKPFRIGDFIIVDDLLGTVEHIGLKTTRVRSLFGEQLIFSNTDLLDSRIRNYQRMQERRVVVSVGVTYDTVPDRLERIPETVRSIVEAQSSTRFDRAHFKGFGPSSLDFEIVYHVLTPDYNTHMDIQQSINLELCRQFERLGIDFAYPTQTLYLHRAPRRDGAGPDARQALRTGDHHAETAR